MPDVTVGDRSRAFARPDLTAFCRFDELGRVVTGRHLEPDRAVLACRVTEPDQWRRRCADLLTDKQTTCLQALFAVDEHMQVEATWEIYQRMIAAYREPD